MTDRHAGHDAKTRKKIDQGHSERRANGSVVVRFVNVDITLALCTLVCAFLRSSDIA